MHEMAYCHRCRDSQVDLQKQPRDPVGDAYYFSRHAPY
ncbi:hypothetical protein FOCG_11806 [Fusarium oxysporum f. sp. radicis-lycopersici 26381]|uniref:Uncharacterized protein n=1 Tax=Fusarium oxysporum Fo47 TaxID=660027 RepID=W9KP93_FUSOX|nr:hypothetical protein FOZG_02397 [Fusarium oxysporum Fo47]EWZ84246.1 hypothetical protein FOWG_12059 [Fusarium oxysporum f. sp. lycopersici MN25]EXL47650.1 hypothetical protein FOCG_11806 [Fusarium oxysporum f. sp. radicis-lycopersici 26381]